MSRMLINNNNSTRYRNPPTAAQLKFDYILDKVGGNRRHQLLLLWVFLVPIAFYVPFGASNLQLMLATPEHHCMVPAREVFNVSMSLWRRYTIPKDPSEDGSRGRYSRCKMHNVTFEQREDDMMFFRLDHNNTVSCQYGWMYDNKWWDETAVTEHNWVCENSHNVPQLFLVGVISNAVGTLFFNLLAERCGRRPIFFICIVLSIVSGVANLFTSNWYTFTVTKFLSLLPYFSLYHLPYIIVLEQSTGRLRDRMAAIYFLSGSCGVCTVALMAWLSRHWRTFGLLCYLPGVMFLLYIRLVSESPRWLLSRGCLEECSTVLHTIAERNGRPDPPELVTILCELKKDNKRTEVSSVFTYPILRKRLIIVVLNTAILQLVYTGIVFNVSHFTRNEFLNFAALALIDVPGILLGLVSVSFLGRRLTTIYTQCLAASFCIFSAVVTPHPKVLMILCSMGKVFLSSATVVVFMQVGELFPTVGRCTVYGITGAFGVSATVLTPFIMRLGTNYSMLPYFILGVLCVLSAIASSLLPETLGKALPHTLSEATGIGYGKAFCDCIHHWNVHKHNRNEENVDGTPNENNTHASLILEDSQNDT